MKLFYGFIIVFCFVFSALAQSADNSIMWLPSDSCNVCDSILVEGEKFRIINDDKIYLAFNPTYEDGYYIANIYIKNKSGKRFDFDPLKDVTVFGWKKEDDFIEQKAMPESFPAVDPVTIVKKIQNRTAWANALGAFGAGVQRKTTTVNVTNGMETATATITGPDTQAQQRAQNQAATNNAKAADKSQSILASALKANTIFPESILYGDVYLKKKKGFEVLDFRITINEKIYSFVYFIKPDKK